MILALYVMTGCLEIKLGVTNEYRGCLGRNVVLHRSLLRAIVLGGDCSTRLGDLPMTSIKAWPNDLAFSRRERWNQPLKTERSCARSGRLQCRVGQQLG